jgi:hypothetical protein
MKLTHYNSGHWTFKFLEICKIIWAKCRLCYGFLIFMFSVGPSEYGGTHERSMSSTGAKPALRPFDWHLSRDR